jgi:2-C-methyl-D-erythritol 4-phosphate cytidylyltransferase
MGQVRHSAAVSVALIIPAAGSGRRLELAVPKALAPIDGVPMLRMSVGCFLEAPGLAEIIVTAPHGRAEAFAEALEGVSMGQAGLRVVPGGATRQESVRLALEALESDAEIVCVHDAARPVVSQRTVAEVIAAAADSGAATAAVRPVDSVRMQQGAEGDAGRDAAAPSIASGAGRTLSAAATVAVDRDKVWLVQTPQAFSRELLEAAHREARATGRSATDDAALVEAAGTAVTVVETDGENPKVTRASDLELVRSLCSAGRSGQERR